MKVRTGIEFEPRPNAVRERGIDRRHSRFVARAKRALPVTAAGLLLLVTAWPRIETTMQSYRIQVPRLDLSEARDLNMVSARYTGIDRQNRPFVITAEIARQKPNLDDLITLDRPKGDLTTASGGWLELSGDSGFYQPQPQLLDLFGNVALFQDRGSEFHSTSAHVDMNQGTAQGDDPITGQGPFGHVAARGFRILDHGDTIIFIGHARLDILPHSRQGQ